MHHRSPPIYSTQRQCHRVSRRRRPTPAVSLAVFRRTSCSCSVGFGSGSSTAGSVLEFTPRPLHLCLPLCLCGFGLYKRSCGALALFTAVLLDRRSALPDNAGLQSRQELVFALIVGILTPTDKRKWQTSVRGIFSLNARRSTFGLFFFFFSKEAEHSLAEFQKCSA